MMGTREKEEASLVPFPSSQHTERNAAFLGIALGICFTACFVTGLLSHLIQHPPSWFTWPSRPAWGYRVTQGIHVTTGIASIPLLLAKLWVVGPKFFTWPPVRGVAHALERASLLPLVAGSLFLLVSGVINTARFYPWGFYFPKAHYTAAWITIGALIVHISLKAATTRSALRKAPPAEATTTEGSRRWFIASAAGAAGLFAMATVGQTLKILSPLSALGQRIPGFGPQGVPVQKTARGAGVKVDVANYHLRVTGKVERKLQLSLSELQALPQRTAELTIACVEGWSTTATWRGVTVRELLDLAGAPSDATVRVISSERRGPYRTSELNASHSNDLDTLLALELNGEALHVDHGAPVRLIGPNRPGVMQTKWVREIRVV